VVGKIRVCVGDDLIDALTAQQPLSEVRTVWEISGEVIGDGLESSERTFLCPKRGLKTFQK